MPSMPSDLHSINYVESSIPEGMTLAGALRIMELQAEIADLRRQLDDRADGR